MILQVKHFKEGASVALENKYDPKALDLDFVDWHYVDHILLKGLGERVLNTLIFRGELTSHVEQICARCLERVSKTISRPFDLSYEVNELKTVDTTNDLRDILSLDRPERFLCRETCKGLCARCGVNLNHEACRCQTSSN